MQLPGRISAAIDVLADFDARRVPLKTALADWARGNRFAGAKDRAWISGLCLDVLRRRAALAEAMGSESPRALALAALRFLWATPLEDLEAAAAEEPHGPGALSPEEVAALSGNGSSDAVLDAPAWVQPLLERAFGDDAGAEALALSRRADVDLRLNTLKAAPEKSLAALKSVQGEPVPLLTTAARIAAPDPSEKSPAVTVIPAFNKGWVEVQDLGSQIAAAAAGAIKGAQVLDYCAGGGGKTLALAALMENTGQLYAYDVDARRLQPVFHRAKRAGVRNLQIRSPAGGEGLDDLEGKMDVVFVDAPCTGSGTWRRHPDTKWRLTEKLFARRLEEQDQVLREAARYVKPGGRLVYATCSAFLEENEDRLAAFLGDHPGFTQTSASDALAASGVAAAEGLEAIRACATPEGALRLTPRRLKCDGFFIAVLEN